jgi:hypothetical protein
MKMRVLLLFALLLSAPNAALAQDTLARHLGVVTFPGLPARGDRPAVPGVELTPEILAVVQQCKDAVASGKWFDRRPDRPTAPVAPPGLGPDPQLVFAADMIDGCLVQRKIEGVYIIPSAVPLGKPQLR